MKKSCKNDEESGRKKCKRLDAKYKKKRAVITDITQSCREM